MNISQSDTFFTSATPLGRGLVLAVVELVKRDEKLLRNPIELAQKGNGVNSIEIVKHDDEACNEARIE